MTALCLLIGLLTPAATTLSFEEFTTLFEEKRADIRIVEARYEQSILMPGETLSTEGRLLYARPHRLVLREEETVQIIDQQRMYDYEPLVRQMEITDFEENPLADIIFAAFDESVSKLAERYDLATFTVLDYDEGSQGLRIRPLPESDAAQYFEEATIYLRDEDFLPYRIFIEHDAETHRLFEVFDYAINHDYDPEDTRITMAPGTRIILNNEPIDTVGENGGSMPEAIYPTDLTSVVEQDLPAPEMPEGDAIEVETP